jgi:hypothetical protein
LGVAGPKDDGDKVSRMQDPRPSCAGAEVALRKQTGDYTSAGAFLYSTPIEMPDISTTDFLFGAK